MFAEYVSAISGDQRSKKPLKPTQAKLSMTEMLTTAEEVQLSAVLCRLSGALLSVGQIEHLL